MNANSRFVNWRVGTDGAVRKEDLAYKDALTHVAVIELVHLLEREKSFIVSTCNVRIGRVVEMAEIAGD